jgi:hypothetical protein
VAHGKHRLDQPADSRRCVQMADVRLGAAQGAEAVSLRTLAEGAGQRGNLDRIAERRCGAVRFNIRDRVGAIPAMAWAAAIAAACPSTPGAM